MQHLKTLLLFISIVALLCACSINNEKKCADNTSQPLENNTMEDCKNTKDQISYIINFTGNINDLIDRYYPNYFQQIENGFRAIYYGDDQVCIVLSDLNGNIVYSHKYDYPLTNESYKNLQIGDSLDTVQNIDPNGEYLFLFTGRTDIPKKSTHCTSDGYYYTITYDENNIITNICMETLKTD